MSLNIPISAIGRSDAPWLADEVTCPCCGGSGKRFFHLDTGREISANDYRQLSNEAQGDYFDERCDLCDGEGQVDRRYINLREWK